jgi:hypothetical protein
MSRVSRWFDLDDQWPHAGWLLEWHHARSELIARGKARRARLAGVDQIRIIGEEEARPCSAERASLDPVPGERIIRRPQQRLAGKAAMRRMRLDWYTRHHAYCLHTSHSGEAARGSRAKSWE